LGFSGSSPQSPHEGSGANLLPESNANSWGEFGRDVGIILRGFAASHYVRGAVNARAARAIDAATEEQNTLVTKKYLDGGRVFQGKPRDFSTSAKQTIVCTRNIELELILTEKQKLGVMNHPGSTFSRDAS
jgi:hypothetical protein